MGMRIEEIPLEILASIVSLAHQSTWKNLRSVNKTLSTLVTPLLYSEIEVWIQTESLLRLQSIASSAELSKHVKTLVITNDYITTKIQSPKTLITAVILGIIMCGGTHRGVEWIDAETANSVTLGDFADIPRQLKDLGWTSDHLFSAWNIQKNLAIEHANLHRDDRDVASLAHSFRNLPNLTCIRLSCAGIGGPQKLSRNGVENLFHFGETTRCDERQLSSFFLAAALASAAPCQAKIKSLIVEKRFWAETESTYTGITSDYERPDFGTLDFALIVSSLPFLAAISTLELQLESRNTSNRDRKITANLALVMASLPALENLILHNSNSQLLQLRAPLQALVTKSLRALHLEFCILSLADIQNIIHTQAKSLKSIHVENIVLNGGHHIELFTTLRNSTTLDHITVKGWLVEHPYEEMLYFARERGSDEEIRRTRERRQVARRFIEDFVKHERDEFPNELCDTDSSVLPVGDMFVVLDGFPPDSSEPEENY